MELQACGTRAAAKLVERFTPHPSCQRCATKCIPANGKEAEGPSPLIFNHEAGSVWVTLSFTIGKNWPIMLQNLCREQRDMLSMVDATAKGQKQGDTLQNRVEPEGLLTVRSGGDCGFHLQREGPGLVVVEAAWT